MIFALRTAWASLRPRRALLTAAGVATAALVLGVALTVAYALQTGFDRAAARSDLPTVVARFGNEDRREVAERVAALPNLAAHAFRYEETGVRLRAGGRTLRQGVVHVVTGTRRGYAVVEGRDVRGPAAEVVVERGLARSWGLHPGDALRLGRVGTFRIAGVAVAPDNVAYPLARTARIYATEAALLRRLDAPADARFPVNVALLWAQDPTRSDVLVSFARQESFGLRGLRFLTADGVRALVEQAAGIVIALLVAFAVVAAGLAGVLLAAGAQSEVQRALDRIGLQRALGLTPGRVVAIHAARGALVAAPAAALGLLAGALLAAAPSADLLASLNELAPSAGAVAARLALVWLAAVALVALCAAIPAWRAARRSPATLMRGGDVAAPRSPGRLTAPLRGLLTRGGAAPAAAPAGRTSPFRGHPAPRRAARGGLALLGARLVAARPARLAAVVAVLGSATAVVLLLLALASLLEQLRDDPGTLGKRYQLTARLPADRADEVRAIDGVEAAAPRYSVRATAGAALGTPLTVVAYPGDHTRFEAPPLAEGRRARRAGEAEVGVGLADAIGLRPGSTLVVQAEAPREARFRVTGVVRALQDEGRVAFTRPERLEAAGASLSGPIAVRLRDGADRGAVTAALRDLGAAPAPVVGATGDAGGLLDVLAALLRVVAGTVALVCLYALVQALALTTRERRGAVATLRAAGADQRALRRLLAGAALAVVLPALVLAVALEAVVLAPVVAQLAAGYADLPLGAGPGQVAIVAGGLLLLAWGVAWAAGRRLVREPVVAGLREEA